MDEEFQSIERVPAKDFSIKEALELKPKACRLAGYVVNLGPLSFVLNDGDNQVEIEYGSIPSSKLNLEQPVRIICQFQEGEDGAKAVGQFAHEMLPEEFEKYKAIVALEKRISYPE